MEKIDNFTQYILKSAKDFEQTFNIEKQTFRFNKNTHFYTIFEKKLNMTLLKMNEVFIYPLYGRIFLVNLNNDLLKMVYYL